MSGFYGGYALVGLVLNNGIIYLLTERFKVRFYPAKLIATGMVPHSVRETFFS